MLHITRPLRRTLAAAALMTLLPTGGQAQETFDIEKFAAALAESLAAACPMTDPGDVAAHEACREKMGTGVEARFRGYHFLFGGEQPDTFKLAQKKTSVFRGDLFQDLYMTLYMYTGVYRVKDAPDGLRTIGLQAYFRNKMPPGRYPYPFWHSAAKWNAYEKANEIRIRMSPDGTVRWVYRADSGSDENRGSYEHVQPPAFLGAWMWRDDSGGAQPEVTTLFSGFYSNDNPTLPALDEAYRKMALSFRKADCTGCHQPEGHYKMNKLTLLQTPLHAATSIDAVLDEVRRDKMPVDTYDDPIPLDAELKAELLENGEAFAKLLDSADQWERDNDRPKARKLEAN